MKIDDLIVDEVQVIVDALATLPFNRVSGLINKITTQAREQLEAERVAASVSTVASETDTLVNTDV